MYTNTWTGTGIGVAILDTGLYPHIDFGERIRGFQDFLGHRPYPYDDSGHGTHVAGILAGDGTASDRRYQGVAPGCHLVAAKVLDRRGNGRLQDVLRALSGSLSIRTSMEYESSIFLWALPQWIQKLPHD